MSLERRHRTTTLCSGLLLLLLSLQSRPAFAMDSAVVSSARALGEQGLKDYDAGKYEESANKLLRAYRIMNVPAPALFAARALAESGKLVQAAELLLEASRLSPNEFWHGTSQQDAQDRARIEREALLPRIARLRVLFSGADPSEVQLAVDTRVVPADLVGVSQFVDPGVRTIVAKRGGSVVETTVTLAEGEQRDITLNFVATKTATQPVSRTPITVPPAPASPLAESRAGHTQRTLAWTALGVSAVGFASWGTLGIMALSKRASMPEQCRNELNCPDDPAAVKAFNRYLTISTVGFVVGAVGATSGLALMLTLPKTKVNSTARLTLTPTMATVSGAF